MNPRFYFATCHTGAEKAVKIEVLTKYPQLKFAFSRPGFITFKEDDDRKPAITKTDGVFTRLWGTVIGQAKDRDALLNLIEGLPSGAKVHAFERDHALPLQEPETEGMKNEETLAPLFRAKIKEEVKALQERLSSSPNTPCRILWDATPKDQERVYDLIWIDESHFFLGSHTHGPHLDPSPGNQPQIELPSYSPSRAYLKIAEAIRRFNPSVEKGMQVLEVGCSPGGATTALLGLGLKVTGIDPRRMDPRLSKETQFKFIQKKALAITPEDLQSVNPDWIVMDMNIAPLEAIDELGHVLSCLQTVWKSDLKLKHGFLTLKLNDWKFSETVSLYLRRLEEKGFQLLTPTQLCYNRQEFFVMARNFKSPAPKIPRSLLVSPVKRVLKPNFRTNR